MFKNIKLGAKLTGGFLAIAALIMLVALLGFVNMRSINNGMTHMYQQNLKPIEDVSAANTALYRQRGNIYQYIVMANRRGQTEKDMLALAKVLDEHVKRYSESELSAEEKETLATFQTAWADYQAGCDEIIAQLKANATTEKIIEQYLNDTAPAVKSRLVAQTALEKLQALKEQQAEDTNESGDKTFSASTKMLVVGTLIGLGLAIGLGLLISRNIARRVSQVVDRARSLRNVCIKNLKEAMEAMASGNIKAEVKTGTAPLVDDSKDELGVLAEAINGMLSQTQDSVKAFRHVQEIMQGLLEETDHLIGAAKEGQLQVRGDASKLQGSFQELVQGFNVTLDAVLEPINEAAVVLEKVSVKDLSTRMTGNYRGDHDKIKQSLNAAVQNLDDALTQVALGAEQVTSAATQISSGSQELSHSASEQAASLEETSSSLQELNSMSSQNAANAREAKAMAEAAAISTEQGVGVMKELNGTIGKIKASSDATAKIVKTIDEIAFQTNLLALNAAVEAARAGDAGKGFAVVAEEVRNLAIRSAEAAKNTANMIEEAVKNAEEGVSANQKMLTGLTEITGQVKKVSEVMAEIATASDQQKEGVTQINRAIEQMNQVTQAVAANAEESASAAEELSSQSTEMMSMVQQFNLTNRGSASQGRGWMASQQAGSSAKRPKMLAKIPTRGNGKEHGVVRPEALIPFQADETVLKEF